jgi:hypothetical protein
MRLNRTVLFVGFVLAGAAIASFYQYSRRTAVEPVELEPLKLRARLPAGGFLESRIAQIAAETIEQTEGTNRIVQRADNSEGARDSAESSGSMGVAEESGSTRGRLQQIASEFAYTRYGKIGDRGLATLMDLRSHETSVKPEGSNYRGLEIAQVREDSILLTYPGEGELRKPRIELDIEPLSANERDPERERALWTRHRELWGNRTEGAAQETPFSRSGQALAPEESERRIQARRTYLEKMSEFHRRLKAEDPTLDPRESPLLPTAEEVARETLEKARHPPEMDELNNVEEETGGILQPQ